MSELAVLGYDDLVMGDDDDEMGYDDEMGAIRRKIRRPAARRLIAPGVPVPGPRRQPLGFGSFLFTNGAAVTQRDFTTEPQRPFRGRRLVMDVLKTAGAATIAVSIASVLVANNTQLPSIDAVGEGAFRPDATGALFDMDTCLPGTSIVLRVQLSALPGAGESILVIPTIYGVTLG